MSNIIQLKTKAKNDFCHSTPIECEKVKILYKSLIFSGFTTCQAFHEAMKLLLIINPNIQLSEISEMTYNIIYPIYDNCYENNIDNHSQN